MMMNVIAIPSDLAAAVRSNASDAQGNALEPEVQRVGGNPCRLCLRRARAGERLTLFSHSPFERQNPYKEYGPIFVHSDGCERYASQRELPPDFLDRPIVLRAYDYDQRIARAAVVVDGATQQRAEQLLSDPEMRFSTRARSRTAAICFESNEAKPRNRKRPGIAGPFSLSRLSDVTYGFGLPA